MSYLSRGTRALLALLVSLLLVALGLPATAAADTIDSEITVESYVTNHQGEVATVSAGETFSLTINLQCSSPDTGMCTNTKVELDLPEPIEFLGDPLTVTPAVATGVANGRKLLVTFNGQGLEAGQLVVLTVKVQIPTHASGNLDGDTVSADVKATADNADTVTDSIAMKLNIPPVLQATTTKKVSPTGTQPALPGRAVTYTLTGDNNSNVSVDSIQIAEPTNPSAATPFTYLAVTGITTLTAPEGADRVQFEWYDGSDWHTGGTVAIPSDPDTLLPADPSLIQGMRFTFTKNGALVPAGEAGTIVVATQTRSNAFDDLASGQSRTIDNQANTIVSYASKSTDDQATGSVTFKKTPVEVTTAKSITGDSLVAGNSTVVTIDATNGIMPVSTMKIDEPESGQPNLVDQGLVFTGFVTSGSTDQRVSWPHNATSAQVVYQYSDDSSDTFSTTTTDTLPAPADGKTVKSFSVTFTGANDAIASGTAARLAFTVTAAPVSVEAGITATNTVKTTVTDSSTTSGSSTASDTVTLLPQRVRASASKTLSRDSIWAAPGSTMTVSLTGSVSQESTIGSDYLTLTDDSYPFWDSFNLRRITSTDIPADAVLTVEYFDGSAWQALTTQTGPSDNWSYTPANPDQIAGLRFKFTPKTAGHVLPIGFNVAPRFEVSLRQNLRSDVAISTGSIAPVTLINEITSAVHNAFAISGDQEVSKTATDSVDLKATGGGGGGGGAPDLIRKYWVTDHGLVDEAQTYALSGDTQTARINWDTDGLSMSKFVVTDDPRGADGGPISASLYNAFDLVRIQPITTAVDPLISYDKVTLVELYTNSGWTDITSEACPTANSCDGSFPGYTLTSDERAQTKAVRLTFGPGQASTTGSIAISSNSSPGRGILLDLKLRNTLRSDSSSYVLGTSHTYGYNTGDPGVVSNRADGTGTLTTPTASGTTSFAGTWSANMIIYDRPLNISMSKSFDQDRLGLPQAATTGQDDYPLITSTLTAENNTATYVPELKVSDPSPDVAGLGAYEYLNLHQIEAPDLPADLSASDVSVDLVHWDGTSATTESGVTLTAALARTAAQLADVIGITVHYGALANLGDSTKSLIASGSAATLKLTYQLRATLRSTGTPTGPVEQITNSAQAAIVSPGGMGCTGGENCDTPKASDTDSFGIVQPTYEVTAGKAISPSSRYEDQATNYTLTIAGQPSGTARSKLMALTDASPTFWNAFDLTSIPAVAVPSPINQLKLSVLTGVGYAYDGTTLSYTCNSSPVLDACWHEGSWTDAVNDYVTLSLPFGVTADQVRGVRIEARSYVDGAVVQWERPSSPNLSVNLSTNRRAFLAYGPDGGTTTPVPSTRPGMATAPGETVQGTITNTVTVDGTAGWLNNSAPYTATNSATSTTQLLHRINQIKVEKTPGKASAGADIPRYDLNETIPFQLKVTNTGAWNMTGLALTDQVETIDTGAGASSGLVPADVTSVFTYKVNGATVTGFNAALDTSTGNLSITVPNGFVLTSGSVLLITANLRFRDHLEAGTTVSNSVTATADRDFEKCDFTNDALAGTSQIDVHTCAATTRVTAAASTPITVTKAVKGVGAGDPSASPGETNYNDLGVISVGNTTSDLCATAGTDGYYSPPCTPITRPGGTERWRLTLANGGNVSANTISAIDVLPAVGDTGVTVGTARKSRFTPLFAGNLNVTLPDGSSAHVVHTYFATAASTPTCNKSDILNDTTPGGTSNCGLTWTEFTDSTSSATLATAKAIKVVVSFADATLGIVPGGQFQVTFDTVTPAQSEVADATTVEPVAWNSAAIGSRTAYVPLTENTPEFPARASLITEPRKAGVALASGRINLAKTVAVPDGALWTGALPTQYTGKLSCDSLGKSVTLNGTATSTDTSTVTLLGPQGSGTGAVLNYNGDGSSTLPLFADCSFTEDAAQGASASTATVTVTAHNSYAGVANVAHGWTGQATDQLSVTNTYADAGFTVTKDVTGPAAKDASGADVAFKDFTYTASCLLNGTQVVPAGERTFTLRDQQSQEFSNLPAGATCSVKETYAASAAGTTIKVTQGSATIIDDLASDTAGFTLVAGDAAATNVAYTNRFTVGAATVTKTVVDPTGLWGNEAFEAHLVCTHPDTIAETVYDGVGTLTKLSPTWTVSNLPTGASCTVTETKAGAANSTSISGGNFTVGADPGTPAQVGITNTFTTGQVKVTKTVQANGVTTTAEPWVSGDFPVTLACTRSVNGSVVGLTVPGGATRSLNKAGNWTLTYANLPTGASCWLSENAAGAVASQPDPTVAITNPDAGHAVTIVSGSTANIGVTNDFSAGKLVIHKTLTGVGTSFFTTAKFAVSCTLSGHIDPVFTASNIAVTGPSYASTELGPIPFGASCDVSETDTGGADTTPGDNTVIITQNPATDDVIDTTFSNAFSAGTVTITKTLTGEAAGESWATTPNFSLAVKCGKASSGPYSYNATVSLKGGTSVQLKDGNNNAILFPYSTHCWASETVTNGATNPTVDHGSFADGAIVVASPGAVQGLGITATNEYTYAGFTVTKSVVTNGATDQDGNTLVYNPSFSYTAACTFNGNNVLNSSFTLTKQVSGLWDAKTFVHLPTGASCTVTETGTGSATSTSINLSQTGHSDVPSSGTATTFTLVKGDQTASVAAYTNTYQVGSAIVRKALAGTGAANWGYQPFSVNLKCTASFTQNTTVYDKTFVFKWDQDINGLVIGSGTPKQTSTIANLPTGASCTATETVNGGANSTAYTNQTFTVSNGTTNTAIVTNTFTQGTAKVQKTMRAGTTGAYTDVPNALPWKNTKFDMTLTCTRNIGGSSTETITKTTQLTGATSASWTMPTGASCSVAETGTTYPTDTPTQPASSQVYTPSNVSVTTGTATLNVYNYFHYGTVTVSKTLTGEAATAFGGGTFTYGVACTMLQNGTTTTVYSNAAVTAKRANSGQTTFASAVVGPIPVGADCTVTETNTAGATNVTPSSKSVALDPILDGATRTAAFTNEYLYAGFTVTKSVDNGGAVDQHNLGVKYTGSYGFSTNCTYNDGLTGATALNTTFNLTDGQSRQFTNLPVGASCTVTETSQANADSVSYLITQNGTPGSSTTGTTTSAFTLVRAVPDSSSADATSVAFTNHYVTGGLNITKAIAGTGAAAWGGGSFTLRTVCTLAGATANDGNAQVFNDTHTMAANDVWQLRNLPYRASCTITEEKSAGANATGISNATPTIGKATNTGITVTNTFHTGTVQVSKKLKVNGTATTAEPWASAGYQMTLACRKDFNDDGTAEAITVPGATKTITGAGSVTWTGLPEGAICGATEGTITYQPDTPAQPSPISVGYGAEVSVGNATTVNQDVTNNFDYGTAQIIKQLAGEGAAKWGGAPYKFNLACTLDGATGNVFEATNITLQRTGTETTLTSAMIGPIPQGADCVATETDKGFASSVSPWTYQSVSAIHGSQNTTTTFTNQFDYAGFTVTKQVSTTALDASGQPVKYTGSYPFTASCTIGSTEILTTEQQNFTLTDGQSKQYTELPSGAICSVEETNTMSAAATHFTLIRPSMSDVTSEATAMGFILTPGGADAATILVTNSYTTGGLQITKATDGPGASQWGTSTFVLKAECTLANATANDGNSFVYSATHGLHSGETWTIGNLPTGAACHVTETNAGGANATSIDTPNPTINTSSQLVTVTNTFQTGSVSVTKAITANGTSVNTAEPWKSGSYPVTLECTKDFGSGVVQVSFDSSFKNKTITGAGTVTWNGLPTGATCTVAEGTSTVADQPQPTASVGSAVIGNGTTGALTLTNEFAAGKLVIHKDITGNAATTWGTGPFTFGVSCVQAGVGTVFSRTGITLTPTTGQTSLDSATLGPIPFSSVCTVTETGTAGATSVTSPSPVTITEDAGAANTHTATFTNEFDNAGFTVTKAITSTAKDATGALITYKAAAYTASCLFKSAEVVPLADRSFTLTAGGSKTFTGLPTGAACTVTETNTRGAATTDVRIKTSGTDATLTGTTSANFALVSGDATATLTTFTNNYTTGSAVISKTTLGTGAALWGTGPFTIGLNCTLANATNTTVFNTTGVFNPGDTWTVPDLATNASCTVTESKTAGANSVAYSPAATFAVTTSAKTVDVRNTYTLGAVKVTKALTVNGTTTTASPWMQGTYTVKLACTRSYNGTPTAIDIPGDAYTVGDAFDGVRAITGNGYALYDNMPTGATCAATEVSSSPVAQSSAISPATVSVGSNPASPQAITVTNDFHTRTMTISKQLAGAGQASFGDGPFKFSASCTLPGASGTVFTQNNISLLRSVPTDTVLTSSAIGPIPVGAACEVTETSSAGADFTPDPVTITIGETAAANVAGFTNQFSAGTVYVSKVLDGAAKAEAWASGATFTVAVECQADLGSGPVQVFSRDVQIKGGQRINVTDGGGHASRVPLGSHCWANETDAQSAGASSVDSHDWASAAVVTSGTPATLQNLELTATNTYEYAGFTVTKQVVQGGAQDQSGAAVEHSGTFDFHAGCTFNGNSVLSQNFSLARLGNGSWDTKQFANLPAGAACTVTESDAADAAQTATVVTQNGTSGSTTAGTATSFNLVRGSLLWNLDSPSVNQAAFTNTYTVGAVTITKNITGTGADAWGDTSFDIALRCTADLDADSATAATTVFDQTRTFTKADPTWTVPNLPAGASCGVTETAWGGATHHPGTQTVTVVGNTDTAVTVTNTFGIGSVEVTKSFTVDGTTPSAGTWADQFDTATATVELTCTRQINGVATAVTVPGGASRTLAEANSFTTTYAGLPANADCHVAETASTPGANGTGFSPSSDVTVPEADTAAVGVTNDYHTGTLTIAKIVTGAGAAFGKGPFKFAVSCTLPGLADPVYATTVSLSAPNLTSAAKGPIPVGAACQVTETETAGATTGAATATATIPDSPVIANAATATMTNDFAVGSVTISKAVDKGGAVDADGKPISYPGVYGFTASCEFQNQGELLVADDQSFTLADAGSRTLSGLPLGAACTITETGAGNASSTTVAIGASATADSDQATVSIAADPTAVAFTNHYTAGAATITKLVTGSGSTAWGNESFTLHTSCTLDTDHNPATEAVNVFDATKQVSKVAPTWELTNLATGADCAVTETATGGANTAATKHTFTVNADQGDPTTVNLTNEFTLGSVRIDKAIEVDGETSAAEPYASARFTVKLACTRDVNGSDQPIDIPGDSYPVGNAADGVRTITGAGSTLYQGLPTGASCTASETAATLALPGANVNVDQPATVGADATVAATITNNYHTGKLAITKALTGAGADAWADTEAIFAVDCSLTDTDNVAHQVFSAADITLSKATSLTSEKLGPIPVGAVCTITETGTGGATVSAPPAQLTIADTDANAVTMTNEYALGQIVTTTELTLNGQPTTADPFTGSKISLELTCEREVNGKWVGITIPGGAQTVITGAGGQTFTGLPVGAKCSLAQTDASITPQGITYRPSTGVPSDTFSAQATVGEEPMTLTAIDDFRTEPLTIEKVLAGAGADDFAVHPFKFSLTCTLAESGVADPHVVYTNPEVTLSKDALVSGELGPVPVGSQCQVTETADGGATHAAKPATVTIVEGADNRAQLTNTFDAGQVSVTKHILVDGQASDAEPYASGTYTMKLACTQQVDSETLPVTIPGGDTRTITGAGTAQFAALPVGASCELSESDTSLALPADQVQISESSFTVGADPVEVSVTNSYYSSNLILRATFTGVGRDEFAKPITVAVDCTLAGATGSVFHQQLDIAPTPGQATTATDPLGPIPVGAVCTVTTLSAHGADALPSTVTITGEQNETAIADVAARYSAGTVTVHKKLIGSGASQHQNAAFKMAITCTQSADGAPVVSGTVTITGAGSATLTDSSGNPVLAPSHSQCWATETSNGGATRVLVDHGSFAAAVQVEPDLPDSMQSLNITVTNEFVATDYLAYTGYTLGWGIPALALLSVGLGLFLVRRSRRSQS